MFYSIVLATHNIVRWLVVLAAVYAVFRAVRGLVTQSAWTSADLLALKGLTWSTSVQFMLGVIVYAFSPLIRHAFGDFGAAMRDPGIRQFALEHPLGMLIFVGLAHVGSARARKAPDDRQKFKTAAIFFALGLLVMLAMIPWNRRLFPF